MRRRANGARRVTVIGLASALALLLAGCTPYASGSARMPEQVPGGFSSEVSGKLDTAVKDAVKQSGASGAVVGVWAPWAGSWTAGIGTTTLKGTKRVTPDMGFRIAGNTMAMTCSVLLGLVDDGKVELDDPVTRYVPGFVGVDGVTLRELCQNTSGIGDYVPQLRSIFVNNPTRVWPALELVSDGIATKRIGNPGEKYGQSWAGFTLLGMALQNATGKSWNDLYAQYVFSKLDMKSSSLPAGDQLTIPGAHPAGYVSTVNALGQSVCTAVTDVSRLSPSMGWTAGGVVSNVPDLKSYVQALASGSLVSDKSAAEQAKSVTIGAEWQRFGLGMLTLGPLRGGVGAMPGYLSAMFSDPSSGLTVVVALNNSTPGPGYIQALAQRLASIVAKVPAKQAGAKTVATLPWSEQQQVDLLAKNAPCAPKPAPAK
jgi:D-alanyl-D-alanine carboxypeptidase